MHYLIDGHNLIAQIPDIQLSDADDEARLVARLRRWMTAGRKRRVTVFFDGGLPGGRDPQLSGGSLTVVFASGGREADSLLIRRIRKAHNPPEYTLVTSDRAIRDVAEGRGMPVVDSQTFAHHLTMDLVRGEQATAPRPSPKEDPALDEKEVAEWLALFKKRHK
jgi:hypothetical protein